MPPRIRLQPKRLQQAVGAQYICRQCRFASLAPGNALASPINFTTNAAPVVVRHAATQPTPYKPAEFRKTQLHRQYQSVLRSSPLILIFQHNNLKAGEWMGIRRELAEALRKVDDDLAKQGNTEYIGSTAKLQVIQTGIFASALKVVEFWDPNYEAEQPVSDVPPASAASLVPEEVKITHGLSKEAWQAANKNKALRHGLEPLLSGPTALFVLPSVSTIHLKAALSILAPSPSFPAPKRKAAPNYYEPAVQNGLQKLMLLGARIEGKVFDAEGIHWVGAIQGGLDGLRAQLVAALQGVGAGVTNTLEAAGRSLYITVEGRRGMLEDESKEKAAA